jgi:hypothetical protein
LRDTEGNVIKIIINCSDTAARIDKIVEEIRKGSRNPALIENLCSAVLRAKTDYTLAYKTCDDMMNAARRRRRVARSRKDCGDAKHLIIAGINAVDDEQVAAAEVKMKEKERYWALYGKGKLAQLVWKEMPVSFDVFE